MSRLSLKTGFLHKEAVNHVIALVCPGQGSQKPGFLSEWLEINGVRDYMAQLSAAAELDLIYYGTEADEESIKDTSIAQPLIVAAGLVSGRLALQSLAGQSIILAGHSVGEITACTLAGVLTDEEAMRFIKVRASGMAAASAASPTGMAAVLGGLEDDVRAAIEAAHLVAANSNGGGQIVAAGTLDDLARFAQTPPAKTRVIPLKVAGAFHTAWMKPAQGPLAQFATSLTPATPRFELLSNYDGQALTDGRQILDSLVAQVTRPVRWDLCMETLGQRQASRIVEVSPAGTLIGLAKRALKGIPCLAVNSPSDLDHLKEAPSA